MNILYVTPRLPYPPLKGDKLRSYNQIKILSERHTVTLVSFIKDSVENEYVQDLSQYCDRVEVVRFRPFYAYFNMLTGFFSSLPFQTSYYYSPDMDRLIRSTIQSGSFDILHLQLIRMGRYLSRHADVPTIIDFVDALSLNMRRRYRYDNGIGKLAAFIEWHRMKSYERQVSNQCDRVLVTSPVDQRAIGISEKVVVVPNGVDTEQFSFVEEGRQPTTLVFTGNLNYFPNVHAVKWFTRDVFPLIKAQVPHARFYVVGADPHRSIRKLSSNEDIVITGFVDSVHDYLARATVAVCPMKSGSGVQNKVLEAMATGTPIVGTRHALDGIEAKSEEHVIVADDPEEFAWRVVELIRAPMQRARLAMNARRLVEEKYTWSIAVQQLERIYEHVVTSPSRNKAGRLTV